MRLRQLTQTDCDVRRTARAAGSTWFAWPRRSREPGAALLTATRTPSTKARLLAVTALPGW